MIEHQQEQWAKDKLAGMPGVSACARRVCMPQVELLWEPFQPCPEAIAASPDCCVVSARGSKASHRKSDLEGRERAILRVCLKGVDRVSLGFPLEREVFHFEMPMKTPCFDFGPVDFANLFPDRWSVSLRATAKGFLV